MAMTTTIRVMVLSFAFWLNAAALYALNAAMDEGVERARIATLEPQRVIVTAPKDGPALVSTELPLIP
jgi:hypothetical protein